MSLARRWSLQALVAVLLLSCAFAQLPLPREPIEDDIYDLESETREIDMADITDYIPFANKEGGVWRQGWQLSYPEDKWSQENPLEVVVMMFSHNDPGWLKTFEGYFEQQTKHIINNVVEFLSKKPSRKFIWTEMSFLSLWWAQASEQSRAKFLALTANGQLEIAGGGWVMNDEAGSHYSSIVSQMLAGHEWIQQNLNVKPNTSYAIDPFGHSPTMIHLLNLAGYKATVINRVHYAFKKLLAHNKALEFRWRQTWQVQEKSTELLTHMFPFFIYDIPHTCGPDPKICARYDFGKVGRTTSWHDTIQPVTTSSLPQLASDYIDQIKKKATLYRTGNVVLIPLGEDFKYDSADEMNQMLSSHEQIHDYINSRKRDFGVNIRFGTLSDYFNAVKTNILKYRSHELPAPSEWEKFFPLLKGDFFTYDDVRQEYWSGYFTSRPFWKNYIRVVESYMRAAEIAHTWSHTLISCNSGDAAFQNQFAALQTAQKMAALFHHHDGITGTAKPFVVEDYGKKLHGALTGLKSVMPTLMETLLSNSRCPKSPTLFVDLENQNDYNSIMAKKTIDTVDTPNTAIVVFNSLTRPRCEIIQLVVDTPNVRVYDSKGGEAEIQLAPVWTNDGDLVSATQVRVFVRIHAPALGYTTYILKRDDSAKPDKSLISTVETRNIEAKEGLAFLGLPISSSSADSALKIANDHIEVQFRADTGLVNELKSLKDHQTVPLKFNEDFLTYSTSGSGAYLFMPKGPANSFVGAAQANEVRALKGHLVSIVETRLPKIVTRTLILYNLQDSNDCPPENREPSYIDIKHNVHLVDTDSEAVTRFSTDVANKRTIFTDLNGFSISQRNRRDDRPIQHNVFPMTETVFIEDKRLRFTINSRQAAGTASMANGQLELWLDRRSSGDDNRGLGEALRDNIPYETHFRLSFAKGPFKAHENNGGPPVHFPSLDSIKIAYNLNHPLRLFSGALPGGDEVGNWMGPRRLEASFLSPSRPVLQLHPDVHLLSLKMRSGSPDADSETIVQLVRLQHDYTDTPATSVVQINLEKAFNGVDADKVQRRSLTLLHQKPLVYPADRIVLGFTDMETFLLRLSAGKPAPPPSVKTGENNQLPPIDHGTTRIQKETPKRETTPAAIAQIDPFRAKVGEELDIGLARHHPRPKVSYSVALTGLVGSVCMLVVAKFVRRISHLRLAIVAFVAINFLYLLIISRHT